MGSRRVGHDWSNLAAAAAKLTSGNAGDPGLIPGSGRSSVEGIGYPLVFLGFPGGSDGKESACNVGDLGLIPRLGSCLVAKLCLTLCDSMGLPGPSVHGISQARILEWIAISFSRGSSQSKDWTLCLKHYSLLLSHQGSIHENISLGQIYLINKIYSVFKGS